MKKMVTLCLAAALATSLSATAYAAAAPCSAWTINKCAVVRQNCQNNGAAQDALRQLLLQQLEKCLPGCSQLVLPTLPEIPADKPNTEAPADKPSIELPADKPCTETPADKPCTELPADKPGTEKPADKPDVEQPGDDQAVTDAEGVSAYAAKVVDLVNAERAKAGLSALTLDLDASRAAQVRAAEIRSSFSHTRPGGKSCFTALQEAGVSYRSAGENIAAGQRTPEEVMTAWMNSEGHRKNILSSQFKAIGVGYLEGGYWTQFFIG